ncbi:hypothetical protein HJC23_012524 [Cyclotella cryptica]|uniref:Cytochrome b561 domain-containing protein n=1 Tax=Cyclotella cryptica TaxID=29204 RepID=A0ABD3QQJ2_9STRA|eukprot:CCRYP_003129-RB/>CCRYP_003129-RB protein AED:0.04 eAED:0.04 QI:300/-1/1/1/-1/1/1/235/380
MPRPLLLLFVLVASSCNHAVVATTDSLPRDRDVSFIRQWRHVQEERLSDPSVEYSTPDREGGSDEEGEDDEYEYEYEYGESNGESIADAEPYRDERTQDNEYRYEGTTTIPDFYDPDETDPDYVPNLEEDVTERSIARSIDTSSSSSSSSSPPNNSKKSTWITHGTLGTLSFGLLIPIAISSALFRDLLPTYWIYIHVFLNVTTFTFTLFAVGMAFATMNSLGDANEGHLKELHHILGLGLLLVVTFQTANGFLRPPREFVTDDEEDSSPGAMHSSSEWGERSKLLSPRALWQWMHRITGIVILALGTWQIQSGLAIFARKFGSADWGSVYLGYMGWVVFVMGGGKLWMKYREKKREGKDEWNAEDELFDTDGLRGLEDD